MLDKIKFFRFEKNTNGLFGNSKTKKRNLIILLSPFVVLLCVFVVLTVLSINSISTNLSDNGANSHENEIEGMNIYLRDNATELQKDLFAQLKQAYKDGNDEEAARLTAESFIADFYTWTNKYGSYDVGGVYYCSDRYNVELYGRDTFYKYVSYYIEEYGAENLLEVVSVEAKGHRTSSQYTIESTGESFEKYHFQVSWEYADHPKFVDEEFCTFNEIIVIKSDTGRFEIVEAYG